MSSVIWDGPELARLYDRISDLQFEGGRKLAEMMDVRKGDVVLDVGCGTGRLAVYLADIVGPSGSVTGIDPSAHRVRVAEEKLKGQGTRNVCFHVGIGEDLGAFRDDGFDHVCYSSVIHWIEDKMAALKEARRVLKPGGNVGMNTVDKEHHFTMRQILDDFIAKKYPEYQHIEDEMTSMLLGRDELREGLERAGFKEVKIRAVPDRHVYSSPRQLFEFMEASSLGNFLRQVPGPVKARMLEDLGKELEKMRTPAGIELTSKMLFATATK
jgi:ubiquinone/menaquinone biosynthesis C-methylase UbiE